MKIRDYILLAIGLISSLVGIAILGYNLSYNYFLSEDYINEVNNNLLSIKDFEERDGTYISSDDSSTLIVPEEAIDVLESNKEVDEVTVYKNVIEIPELNIVAYINEGVDKKALKHGVGHHTSTVKIGDNGNCVIAGHSSITYKCIFNGLDTLELLDTFNAYDSNGIKHIYYITDRYICSPSSDNIIKTIRNDLSVITLYTCADRGVNRLVLVGQEFNEEQLNDFISKMNSVQTDKILEIDSSINVESISYALDQRSITSSKTYVFDFPDRYTDKLSTSKSSCYCGVLFDKCFDNEHELDNSFNINAGIKIEFEEVLNYDISEN